MSSDPSVSLRIQTEASKEGAKALADQAYKANVAASNLAQAGVTSYQMARQALRDTSTQGASLLRQELQSAGSTLRAVKALAGGGRGEQLRSFASNGLHDSASLDRQLIRLQQSSGMSNGQRHEWRDEGARIARAYGLNRADVDSGFGTLIGAGLSYSAAKKASDALGRTSAVTGSDSATLGQALLGGASAFNVDLNQDGAALGLLQKMTVAGRLGGPGFEQLTELFPRIGASAASAGLSIEQTLALLGTLPKAALQSAEVGALISAARPANFSPAAGSSVTNLGVRAGQIGNAAAVFGNDLNQNLASASGTSARVKATVGQALDRMAQPLNNSLAQAGSYLLDDLNLSGEHLLGTAAAAGIGAHYAGRGAGALFNRFVGAQTLQNVAVGKVLQDAAGVTSVFVTNWPVGSLGIPDIGLDTGGAGAGKKPGLGRLRGLLKGGGVRGLVLAELLDNADELFTPLPGDRLPQPDEESSAAQNAGADSAWLHKNAARIPQDGSGLNATDGAASESQAWASGLSSRLVDGALAMPIGSGAQAAETRLAELLSKPLVIEVRTDSDMIMAEVERRTEMQMRRGQ
jgi:hypothetical protein